MFKLPIEYITHNTLDSKIIDNIDFNQLYLKTFSPETSLGKEIIPQWYSKYTTNKQFLRDSHTLITKSANFTIEHSDINVFLSLYNKIKEDKQFLNNYQYIDYKHLSHFNENLLSMQLLSIYNFMSPLVNLITPIVALIIPFFILKLQNKNISLSTYKEFIFNNMLKKYKYEDFINSSFRNKIYILITSIFYFLSIYQNIMSSIKFYKNHKFIAHFFKTISRFFSYVSSQHETCIDNVNNLKTYSKFKDDINANNTQIKNIINSIGLIQEYDFGKKMIYFHKFKFDKSYIKACEYSLKFIGFIDNIHNVNKNKSINKCVFSKKTILKKYHSPLIENTKIIKNSCDLSKNYIISGPNASGKTTTIKSILLNIVLSQQIGCGYYEKASINPYHHFYCYLNIPDTNNRDSLFQAEAKQCKYILDIVKQKNKQNHFIIFDELYSGTNPEQAIESAHLYLKYLGNYNVSFLLTTHFYELCNRFLNSKCVTNISMKSSINTDKKHVYHYKIQKGISTMKSGFEVLEQLEYPKDITDTLKKI